MNFLTSYLHLPSSLSNVVGFFLTIFVKVCGLQSEWLGGFGVLPVITSGTAALGDKIDTQGLDMVGLATNILQHATATMWKV
jgi:hypothetical protein